MKPRLFLVSAVMPLVVFPLALRADPVFDPNVFFSPTILDYSSSPAGVIPPGSPVTNQYESLDVLHDGHTTTPPGPAGMSSLSGLPGLEAGSGDLTGFSINITFTGPVIGVGAYYLMGGSTNAMTLSAFDEAEALIESVTVLADDMTLGPYGFNEGFVGLVTEAPITRAEFESDNLAFVIDDLHFVIPEPASLTLLTLGVLALIRRRRQAARGMAKRSATM